MWLIYADAFNKNWTVSVDSKTEPIFRANIAFKAIKIEPGKHDVSFVFIHSITGFVVFGIMMILLACTALGMMVWQIIPKRT